MAADHELPAGCGYQGYEFGAGYLDSMCCGGKLFDCDDCDNEGNLYEPIEDIPCPMCHPKKAMAYWADRNRWGGAGEADSARIARSLVTDIRARRGVGTRF